MTIKLTERQRKIALQALTNFEYDIRKVVYNMQIHDENTMRVDEYLEEVREAIKIFEKNKQNNQTGRRTEAY